MFLSVDEDQVLHLMSVWSCKNCFKNEWTLVSSEDLLFDLMNNIIKKLQNFRTDIASPIIVTLKQGSFYTVEVSSYQDSNGAKVLF